MNAEAGPAALWLAAALAVVQAASADAARPVALAQALMALVALTLLPGWILLPVAIFALAGAIVALRRRMPVTGLRVQAAISLGCYAYLLATGHALLDVESGPAPRSMWSGLPMIAGAAGLALYPWLIATAMPRGLSFGAGLGGWSRRALSTNAGMAIALVGGVLMATGVVGQLAFEKRVVALARPGTTMAVGPWLVQFATVNPTAGPHWTAIEAELRASRGSGVSNLRPQSRTFIAPPVEDSPPAIATFWDGRLSAALAPARGGSWQVRLGWTPLVALIWLGEAVIAFGGLIVLGGLLWRARRRRSRQQERDG